MGVTSRIRICRSHSVGFLLQLALLFLSLCNVCPSSLSHLQPHRRFITPEFSSSVALARWTSRKRQRPLGREDIAAAAARKVDPSVPTIARAFSWAWWRYHAKVGLAGGIAGSVGTTLLHPVDCAKTLRQANPEQFPSVQSALWSLVVGSSGKSINGSGASTGRRRLYAGVLPAAVGAIPSSALYFGAYESMKSLLLLTQQRRGNKSQGSEESSTLLSRLWVHAAAAASGNVLSSAVFVPKEFLKQNMQNAAPGTTLKAIIQKAGIRGLYRGYQATLLRNIPTAALRFVLYEELKWRLYTKQDQERQRSWTLFAAGAVAGALASGFFTPMDVLKTRMTTGSCPIDSNVQSCFQHVLGTSGWHALYAGAGSRMFFSGAFSAIGFGTFELAKRWLGVSSRQLSSTSSKSTKAKRKAE